MSKRVHVFEWYVFMYILLLLKSYDWTWYEIDKCIFTNRYLNDDDFFSGLNSLATM